MCLSCLAAFDLLSRLTFHFITDQLNFSNRKTYVAGLVLLCVIRSVLAEITDYRIILVIVSFFGYVRALVVVNQVLLISDLCTKYYPHKFAGALGMNMIFRGVIVLAIGQMMGLIRDHLNSYVLSLHSENLIVAFILIVWLIEYISDR